MEKPRETEPQRRLESVSRKIKAVKNDLGKRLSETKRLFANKVFAVDIHTHSTYSDGSGSVRENLDFAKNAGLDFIFATDHGSLGQKRELLKTDAASWGQEPGAGLHHIGLLNNQKLFQPALKNIAADYKKAGKLAPFVWIPHPAGWYPDVWYKKEQIKALDTLGDSFAMEVINGANKIFSAYDEFDAAAVKIWDKLLCAGKRVTGLGGSDAHDPEGLGCVWTGVFAEKLTPESIIAALRAGKCFASEAALIGFSGELSAKGSKITLRYRAADSAGLNSLSVVSNGAVVTEIYLRGQALADGELTFDIKGPRAYFRLEAVSSDGRRALSNPVYAAMK
jgi:hypothetical protein